MMLEDKEKSKRKQRRMKEHVLPTSIRTGISGARCTTANPPLLAAGQKSMPADQDHTGSSSSDL